MYTDDFINELINCPKRIIDSPKETKESRNAGFIKTSFSFQSIDDNFRFTGFITQNLTFSENFSVGLAYNPKEERGVIILVRCNGQHGGTKANPHHAYTHVHKATAERINNNLKAEGEIEATSEYSTIDTAIQYFIKLINLIPEDRQKYFPPPSAQLDMFDQ